MLSAIEARNLPDLRWPDFSDYGKLVKEFHELYAYSLPWELRRINYRPVLQTTGTIGDSPIRRVLRCG